MTRTFITGTACLLLISIPATAPANDIVDFLNALNGPRVARRAVPVVPVGHRGRHDHHAARHDHRRSFSRRPIRPAYSGRRSGLSFSVSLNSGRLPVAPAPVYAPPAPVLQPGDIVNFPVALEPHVRIKDLDEVAPGAVPVVIAVRDPHLGRYGTCVEKLVYVEVLVPTCPLQRVRVSPCHTKIRLDYGRYEIDIVSRNDCIEIDYDN